MNPPVIGADRKCPTGLELAPMRRHDFPTDFPTAAGGTDNLR